jgi:hypothetical protein
VTETGQDSAVDLSAESDSSIKSENDLYTSKVIVAREGEIIFPVEILVRFDDGSELLEKWDGKGRYTVYEYRTDKRLVSAQVDPDRKVWLDVNFLNNGQTLETSRAATSKYSLRWLFWMQNILQYLAILG